MQALCTDEYGRVSYSWMCTKKKTKRAQRGFGM